MDRVNIAAAQLHYDSDDPEGFRAGAARLGPSLGARETGTTLYELPPGQAICPYHYECGEEEWLLVLAGRPTLRRPGGEEQLDPLDIAFFAKGREGAHSVRNDTGETVRVLMFSSVVVPTATVYPDSDKVGIWTGDPQDDLLVRRESAVGYYDGEV